MRYKGNVDTGEDTFAPAPSDQCEDKKWHNEVRDIYGHPIDDVWRIHATWKRGGVLQRFYTGFELTGRNQGKWSAPEIDCTHGLCHVHPNGHHPPSGNQERLIELMPLHSEKDVIDARNVADAVMTVVSVSLSSAKDDGGEWDEQRITELSVSAATEVVHEVIGVRNGSKR